MFSLICVWINGWVNNREVCDLRRYCAHYDVTVMQRRSERRNKNLVVYTCWVSLQKIFDFRLRWPNFGPLSKMTENDLNWWFLNIIWKTYHWALQAWCSHWMSLYIRFCATLWWLKACWNWWFLIIIWKTDLSIHFFKSVCTLIWWVF